MNALRIFIFVIVMGTVSSSMLVGLKNFTSPLIAKNEEFKLKSTVLDVLEVAYDKANIIKIFDEQVKVIKKDKYTFYSAVDDSIAFEFLGTGLWGPIAGIISLEKDLKTIRKIKITHQEETPGLGGRIAEADYLKQFKKKEVFPVLVFVPQGNAVKNNEVDAITGATGSSKALEKLINANIQKYLAAFKG